MDRENGILESVSKCQAGDKEAFAEIVRNLAPKAYGLAYSFLRDPHDAEDISQEAFVKAFTNIRSFDLSHSFESWFLTIVANLSRNKLRWRKLRERLTFSLSRKMEDEDEESGTLEIVDRDKKMDPEQASVTNVVRTQVQSALSQLPEQQQIAVRLKFLEGYKISEVARLMKIQEGTVKTHIFRGLERLKKLVGGIEP